MDALLSYEHFWLAVSLAFIVAGLFVSICRKATERFSRKAMLERSVDWSQERVERFARFKEDYEGTLGNLDIVLRCIISCCMLLGELPEGGFELSAECGILVLKIVAVQILVLELLASIIGRLWPEAWLARFYKTDAWPARFYKNGGLAGSFL